MKKGIKLFLVLSIILILSGCSKNIKTIGPTRTVSKPKPYEGYALDRMLVTIKHEESLKFIDYTIEDFKIDGILCIAEFTDYMLGDHTYNDYTLKKFSSSDTQDYYKSQTVDNFKRKYEIVMNYKNKTSYPNLDGTTIYDAANRLLQLCDFVETVELYAENYIDDDYYTYYDDKIIINLKHDESIKFKTYTIEDFGIDNIESIEEVTYNYDEYYKIITETEEDLYVNFYRSFILHMNYHDVEQIKKDAEEVFNKNKFIKNVVIREYNSPYIYNGPGNIVVKLSHEESIKFKEYTAEDFIGTQIYTHEILNIVDLTYVYKEIIDSNNIHYDINDYHKVLMITVNHMGFESGEMSNVVKIDSRNFDFIEDGGIYGYVSESETK